MLEVFVQSCCQVFFNIQPFRYNALYCINFYGYCLTFLLVSFDFQYAGINIGPVHKKDIMRASVMLEHDSQ